MNNEPEENPSTEDETINPWFLLSDAQQDQILTRAVEDAIKDCRLNIDNPEHCRDYERRRKERVALINQVYAEAGF